uniref:Reverse transcriptase domain-containing protein n=1 Tax=Bracon brevicornis TaxID=1563983 RepID=A0A6V7JM56_9HYME
MGDLNIDLGNENSDDYKHLRQTCEFLGMHILPFKNTHHSAESDSWLDVIMVTDPEKILDTFQNHVSLSHHDLIGAKLNMKTSKLEPRTIVYRNFENFNENDYLQDLKKHDWEKIFSAELIDEKVLHFTRYITDTINQHAPLRITNVKKPPAPWLTSEVKTLMRERDAKRAKARKTKNKKDFDEYRRLRDETSRMVKWAKMKNHGEKIENCQKSNDLWKTLRHNGLIKNNNKESEIMVDINDLAKYYSEVGKNDNENSENGHYRKTNRYKENKNNKNGMGYFSLKRIDEAKLLGALGKPNQKSLGPDQLSGNLIKMSLPVCLESLLHIMNCSITKSVFPQAWKYALIKPIPKKKEAEDLADYRPISLTCYLAKVLEKLVAEQVMIYLEENSLLNKYQSGFRKNMNTQAALLNVIGDMKWAIDQRKISILVLFDYSKAFDRVDHNILIKN